MKFEMTYFTRVRSLIVFGIPAMMFLQFNSNLFPYIFVTERPRDVTELFGFLILNGFLLKSVS